MDELVPAPDVKYPATPGPTEQYTHIQGFCSVRLQGSGELELVEPHNFPQPRNTTLLHEFVLATTRM